MLLLQPVHSSDATTTSGNIVSYAPTVGTFCKKLVDSKATSLHIVSEGAKLQRIKASKHQSIKAIVCLVVES